MAMKNDYKYELAALPSLPDLPQTILTRFESAP